MLINKDPLLNPPDNVFYWTASCGSKAFSLYSEDYAAGVQRLAAYLRANGLHVDLEFGFSNLSINARLGHKATCGEEDVPLYIWSLTKHGNKPQRLSSQLRTHDGKRETSIAAKAPAPKPTVPPAARKRGRPAKVPGARQQRHLQVALRHVEHALAVFNKATKGATEAGTEDAKHTYTVLLQAADKLGAFIGSK